MLRASDVFGKRPAAGAPKIASSAERPISKTWDPATGKYYEEELPLEVLEMMGGKRPKTSKAPVAPKQEPLWQKRPGSVLGPSTVGLGARAVGSGAAVASKPASGLKVELEGFTMPELNTEYTEKPGEELQGRPSYWDASEHYFVYWQSSMKRWAICDTESLKSVQCGLAPGWAYRTDSRHFAKSGGGWMEAWGQSWKKASVACTVLEGIVHDDWSQVKAELGEDGHPAGHSGRSAAEQEADDYEEYENAELPKLSATDYALRIQAIFVKHSPQKLAEFARLLAKFRSREGELYQEVCKKYGEHPVKFHYRYLNEQSQQE